MVDSGIFRDLPATSFRGSTSSSQVLDDKCVCSFRQTCNCPFSGQPEPGRITEIAQNTLPALWILEPTLGEGKCMCIQQSQSSIKGWGKGVEKAWTRPPHALRLWKKEKCSEPGLISPEPKEMIHERDGFFSRKREITFQKGTPLF